MIRTQTDDEENDCVGIDKLKEWNFNATIQVTCDGYRTFETALVRVAGDSASSCPCTPPTSTAPIRIASPSTSGTPSTPSPVLHEPLFDYDFDVSPTDADNIRYLYDSSVTLAKQTNLTIALVSGRRSGGDGTTLATAATDLVFTTMRIPAYLFFGYDKMGNHVDDGNVLRPDLNNFLSMPGSQALGGVSETCHSISNLQVTDEPSPFDSIKFPVCCITFLDRTGDTAADTLGTNAKPRWACSSTTGAQRRCTVPTSRQSTWVTWTPAPTT